jgi:hypothetical protein
MSQNARAVNSGLRLPVPECDEKGFYLPQQRRPDNTAYCVNDFGEPALVQGDVCGQLNQIFKLID